MRWTRLLAVAFLWLSAAVASAQSNPCSPFTLCSGGGGPGSGDVVGPASATDEAVCRFDTTTGKLIDDSLIGISDAGAISTAAGTNLSIAATAPVATTGASQAGKTAALSASNAVASTDTEGAAAGGAVTITSGAAARLTSGNADGGNIVLSPGAGIGTGVAGQIVAPQGTVARPGITSAADAEANSGVLLGSDLIYLIVGGREARFETNDDGRFMIRGSGSGTAVINGTAPSATIPNIQPDGVFDSDTGLGHAGANLLSIIAGGAEIARASQGVASVSDGLTHLRAVETNTAVAASPNVLVASEAGRLFHNEGATAENHHNLPAAAAGIWYEFCVTDADGIQVNAVGDDQIRVSSTVISAAAGFVSSTTIGACLTVNAVNSTLWIGRESEAASWTADI